MGARYTRRLEAKIRDAIGVHPALRHVTLAMAWLLLWRVSELMQYAPHASIWFPPAGLTFAALLIMGWRAMPVLVICAMLATVWVDRMYQLHTAWHVLLLSGVLFGVVHCLSYGVGAGILRRTLRKHPAPSLPVLIVAFLILGSLAALSAALGGIAVLKFTGMLQSPAAVGLWLPWWIGDMAGALVLTPLFLGLLSWSFPQIEPWLGGLDFQPHANTRGHYAPKLLVSLSLLSAVMMLAAHFRYAEVAFGVFFLIIPQMWIVYTESPFRSALSLALFSTVLALWVPVLGLIDQALVYQFAICVIAANAYFGLAVPVLVARNRQLTELAYSDDLTKTVSKGHFFERAERELANARQRHFPVSLIVLDIDHFKTINDHYGHAVGDQALIRLALVARTQLRQTDIFGRFGGDEFMLLLPGVDLDHALDTAERLRQLLWRTDVPGTPEHFSASFGVVDILAGETIKQAFRRADQQLLQAKRNGRNSIGSEKAAPAATTSP